jgi:transposase-like protein
MNFFEFIKKFPTELSCIKHFIKIRYPNGVKCNHCKAENKVYHIEKYPKNFICFSCENTFSIFTNTIFEKSCTDLRKWMYAIHLFLNGKKGISGCQLQREISVTYCKEK